ncbi:unnamed protein product [Penicillium salamii]|uniref:Uncharacterized protein n=1 Tax=Penicillium salamii TaxID=1612424 RepID=A0A9W4J2G4_9EURO|nr:unnamed protein product [Penicillium salamii]CAG8061580.1 unnamed protein product [Penicillium salamii]CAG8089426.1 unnamed protein product [Penicillium salamii]CAG8108393.1 unnamed protein product [Penicillium salamii]CAG8361391.1 unnamed protein product [Penicillium salamii]
MNWTPSFSLLELPSTDAIAYCLSFPHNYCGIDDEPTLRPQWACTTVPRHSNTAKGQPPCGSNS